MNKDNFKKEIDMQKINKIIKKTSEEVVNRTMEELNKRNMIKDRIPYHERVIKILCKYDKLKESIKQKEEDIQYIKENGLPKKSCSIVIYSSSSGLNEEDRYSQLLEKYEIERIETQRDIDRIERAINKIRDDKYFIVIELKYLMPEKDRLKSDEEIAEKLNKDRKTILNNRKRLIGCLVDILFPESVRELL